MVSVQFDIWIHRIFRMDRMGLRSENNELRSCFKNEIAMRERAMTDSVENVRRIPGDVLCSTFVSYRAGKPFAVDLFNVQQRILSGALPKDAITDRVAAGTLTIIEVDPYTQWR